jgi:hypothetical protein
MPAREKKSSLRLPSIFLALLLKFLALTAAAQPASRYTPGGVDFVITNGAEFFNRPLYGVNNPFRVDAGDQPEFSLYLPGRGGNLRLGLKTSAGVKWLNDADQIVARYRPGEMIYEIKDPLLTDGRELRLTVLPLSETRGFIVRAELNSVRTPVQLFWAFGGANGMRGARGGDIGCEREPVAQFFQLRPEQCAGEKFSIAANTFLLRSKTATIAGIASAGATHAVADARAWPDLAKLLASVGETNFPPVVVGQMDFPPAQPVYLALQPTGDAEKIFRADELPGLFSKAEERRRAIAERVVVETPDPFVNAAAGALNVAADAIWDAQQKSFMHGAVAWRQRLLGWRGPYAGDELGWHERTAAHFESFARQQITGEIPAAIPAPEESANLARNETALHSDGDLTKAHYDMNLLAVDAFFRHLLWTGDLEFARANWPVIEKHFGWERRLFRREFGPDKLPLYEGYAAIWASDDLAYDGGGAAHASALNFFANKMAARVAKLIGEDSTPYAREADLISRAMQKYLWVGQASRLSPSENEKNEDRRDACPTEIGHFAEFKDYLGLQLAHPNAALWTFYHTIDSEIPTPEQSWQMSRWVDENLAHIPIQIGNRQSAIGNPFILPTTSWMPYQWSLNNVVVAENAHAALGFWQANRAETAFALFKGTLLETMFDGLCPGNVGCMTAHDMARGEAQRDFGDGIGAVSRALVEGLFGVKPDALAGELKIAPGFPADWQFAKIRHPDFNFEFRREDVSENFSVESKFPKPMKLRLQIPASRNEIAGVTLNGEPASFDWLTNSPGEPRVEIFADAAARWKISVTWRSGAGVPPARFSGASDFQPVATHGQDARATAARDTFDWSKKIYAGEKFDAVDLAPVFNDTVTQIFRNDYRAPRSPFCSLATPKQGIGSWCHPDSEFGVDDSGLRARAKKSDDKIILPDGVPLATPGAADAKNVAFVSQWENYPREISVPLAGKSARAFLLMAGSTGAMQSQFDNGEVVVTYADGATARLALRNPTTWWPIEQDYYVDDFAFRFDGPLPVRVDLKTGKIRVLKMDEFAGAGGTIPGGAATVLNFPLDATKELKSLTVRALANEVVIGLMSVTLQR